MATVDQVTRSYYRRQRQISSTAARSAVAQWNLLDSGSLTESWLAGIGRLILGLITQAQWTAAEEANPYLAELATAQGVSTAGSALVVADKLAGVASDGRPLESLLFFPVILVKRWIGEGRSVPEAMAHGRNFMTLLAATQVADAGRAAVNAGITANKRWTTYVRIVNLPACSRCILLAGREYSWSTGFLRHPSCDCTMRPLVHDEPIPAMPSELFDRMTPEQQDKAFGKAGADAIRHGADIGQVVNARRGMQTAGGRLVTTEGTTRRGVAGRRGGARTGRQTAVRPMPEQIIKDAVGDRGEAIRLLKRFSYIV